MITLNTSPQFFLYLIPTGLSSAGAQIMVPQRNVLERTQYISIKLEVESATQQLAFWFGVLLLMLFYDLEPADKEEGYSTD